MSFCFVAFEDKIIYTDTYSWPDRDSYCCSSRPLPLALSVKNRDYVKRKSNHASIMSMKTEKTDTSQSAGISIYSVAHTTPAHIFFHWLLLIPMAI